MCVHLYNIYIHTYIYILCIFIHDIYICNVHMHTPIHTLYMSIYTHYISIYTLYGYNVYIICIYNVYIYVYMMYIQYEIDYMYVYIYMYICIYTWGYIYKSPKAKKTIIKICTLKLSQSSRFDWRLRKNFLKSHVKWMLLEIERIKKHPYTQRLRKKTLEERKDPFSGKKKKR